MCAQHVRDVGFFELGLALNEAVQVGVDEIHHDVQLVFLRARAEVLKRSDLWKWRDTKKVDSEVSLWR